MRLGERLAFAQEWLKLKQEQQRREAMLAQLSPIQQIHIPGDTVTERVECLLSIDFMTLFHTSTTVLSVVGTNQPKSTRNRMGPPKSPESTLVVEKAVNLPLVIAD